jgi:hypothetical protein
MRARLACALLVAASLGVLACAGDNSLGGSVDALFPLSVSFVEIRRNEESFQVGYYNNRGHDIDLVAQVTVALYGITLQPGQKVDLAGEYDVGHPRTTVVHAAADEAPRLMPALRQGDLVLSQGGNPDELTRGDFSVGFVEGSEYGAGRTLYGNFLGTALDAGFEPPSPDAGP